MTAPVRVAHLVSHPIQYFAPLYRELERRDEIDLTVYFYSDASVRDYWDPGFDRSIGWGVDLLSGYRTRVLPSAAHEDVPASRKRLHLDVAHDLVRSRYDVVWVHGYAHLATWIAAVAARVTGAGLILREEQTLLNRRSFPKRVVKEVLLRALFSQITGLYIGSHNYAYMQRYGVAAERLVCAPYSVDNASLQAAAADLARRRDDVRATLGIHGCEPVILFCGKLIEKKDPFLLIDAFAQVRCKLRCWLLIVGDGPMRKAIEASVAEREIPNVIMPGFLNQTELPKAYASADVFVLPSRNDETWGLVVNEAMNFSLPVVVTDMVGCAPDLVRDGWNGYVVPSGDAHALAQALSRLVLDSSLRSEMGARSQELVDRYSVKAAADGIVAACMAVPSRQRKRSILTAS